MSFLNRLIAQTSGALNPSAGTSLKRSSRGLAMEVPAGMVGYPQRLRIGDFASANTTLDENKYVEVGSKTVSAQQALAYGQGTPANPANQGYLYAQMKDASNTEFDGYVRFVVSNANGTDRFVVKEEHTSVTDGSTSNREQQIPFPETKPLALEDSKLVIEVKPDDASKTFSYTNSTFYIPVTVYQ